MSCGSCDYNVYDETDILNNNINTWELSRNMFRHFYIPKPRESDLKWYEQNNVTITPVKSDTLIYRPYNRWYSIKDLGLEDKVYTFDSKPKNRFKIYRANDTGTITMYFEDTLLFNIFIYSTEENGKTKIIFDYE